MTTNIIIIVDQRAASCVPVIPAYTPAPDGTLADTRGRLSTDGKLYTCLFAWSGHDLRALIRSGKSDKQIAGAIGLIWNQREDRYSEIRTEETARRKKVEMSYLDG